jgi:aminoglycoside 6'-N-acetyltransferase
MEKETINIRKMSYHDYEIMAKWLSTPGVLEFYGDINSPFSLEQVITKYEPRIKGESLITPYIVELNTIAMGFIQRYRVIEKEQLAFGYQKNQIVYGIDLFIGEPKLFGKGYGTQMVMKFVNHLFRTSDAEIIILDPKVSNERAIRCYEKCGFVKVKKINHETCWLMSRVKMI